MAQECYALFGVSSSCYVIASLIQYRKSEQCVAFLRRSFHISIHIPGACGELASDASDALLRLYSLQRVSRVRNPTTLVKRIFQQSSNPTMCGIRSDSNIPQSIVPRNAIFRDRYRFNLETHPKVYSIQARFASKLATIVSHHID